ncbi:phosphotransferase [Spirosoma luteum]|uniref:phosphotransferase n=1 Tax=Spirosoma luteum TaxID=431553 RepID=UPI00035CEA0E|nr:phosphotransferase [Spirosoma luteum]
MALNQQFADRYPNVFFLEERASPALQQLLKTHGWIHPDESILSVQKPGEGNMNVVVRVRTDRQTFILKQARPWVQKYPQVPAPMERISVEASFYQWIDRTAALRAFVPKRIGYDAANFLLALEDLGNGADFSFLYQPHQILPATDRASLVQFLSVLHTTQPTGNPSDFPDNRAMRLLNHEHLFNFPFRTDTGFDLDSIQPGLEALSLSYRNHAALKKKITELGDVYLQPGPVLIHGDYYPGSWLSVASGTKVIDPEFGFFGRPEFDLGVMLAHMKLARQSELVQQQVLDKYQMPAGFDSTLLRGFIGTEMLRRLLGLAQLPLPLDLTQKKVLLEEATVFVLETV